MATLTPRTGIDLHYVGFTDGGVPDAGSFAMGDWCSIAGGIGLCIEAGTPGRWIAFTVAGTPPIVPASPTTFTQTFATADATVPAVTYVAPAVTVGAHTFPASGNLFDAVAADLLINVRTDSVANAVADIAINLKSLAANMNQLITDLLASNAALALLAADGLQNRKLINKLIDVDQAASLAL